MKKTVILFTAAFVRDKLFNEGITPELIDYLIAFRRKKEYWDLKLLTNNSIEFQKRNK